MLSWKNKSLQGATADKLGKNFWTYGILIACLGAMTFFGVCDPNGRRGGGGGSGSTAATVGGEVISRTEFQRAYQRAYSEYQRMYQDAFNPGQMRLAHNVMRQLVDDRAMYGKAVELGLKASDDEVLQLLSKEEGFKGEDGKFSDEIFGHFLEGNGYTEASFMDEVRRSVTVQKFRRFIADSAYVSSKQAQIDYKLAETKIDVEYVKFDPQKLDANVSAADVDKFLADEKGKARVKEYFDANTKEFNQPEQVKARHILVSFKGARNAAGDGAKRDKDAAKKRAEELLAKAKAAGTDFAALAKESTDEPSGKTSGGDLGWFGKDAMVKEFADVAFALPKGQLSGVVESPFGFHIIKVEDKKAAVATKLEDAQRKIAETILAKEKRPAMAKAEADKVLEKLKAKQPEGPLLTEYKTAWASTGDVTADARYLPGIGSSKEVSDALATLYQAGQLYPTTVDVRGNLYILRLKARKEPDMSKFDKDKQREVAMTASYTDGNSLFGVYQKQVLGDLEKKNRVWMNPELLALDDRSAKDENTGS